jgi:hypothetical protein
MRPIIDTGKNNLYLIQTILIIYQKGVYYSKIKVYHNLLIQNKNVAGKQKKFIIFLKSE